MKDHSKQISYLILIIIIFLLILLVAPFIGSQSLDYYKVINYLQGQDNPDGVIFFRIRFPRVLLSMISGASLALAGVIFQALMFAIP